MEDRRGGVECNTVDEARLARVVDLVEARRATAQLCVIHRGRVVLDHRVGCAPDALFWVFSTSKPYVALLVHLLAERGRLDLDDPVAKHWPEYGQRGKDAITIRHVLQHRAGVPMSRSLVGDALAMPDWARAVREVERAAPRWPAGAVPAYHVISYGVILGELVQRVSGVPVRDLLRTEFLDPLGLRDTHLGVRVEALPRVVPVRGRGSAARVTAAYFNRTALRTAVVPSAGVSTTARDAARFSEMLLCGGSLDGVRVLAPGTVAEARRPSSENEVDRIIRLPIRWSQGFQLGGPSGRPMGRRSNSETFGHNGSNACIAWADPTRDLAVAYLTNLVVAGHDGARHQAEVADAILEAVDA